MESSQKRLEKLRQEAFCVGDELRTERFLSDSAREYLQKKYAELNAEIQELQKVYN